MILWGNAPLCTLIEIDKCQSQVSEGIMTHKSQTMASKSKAKTGLLDTSELDDVEHAKRVVRYAVRNPRNSMSRRVGIRICNGGRITWTRESLLYFLAFLEGVMVASSVHFELIFTEETLYAAVVGTAASSETTTLMLETQKTCDEETTKRLIVGQEEIANEGKQQCESVSSDRRSAPTTAKSVSKPDDSGKQGDATSP